MRNKREIRKQFNGTKHKIGEDNKKERNIDTALVIGFLSTFGYYVAYTYHKGYLSYFKLDEIYARDITIVSIIIAIVSLSVLFLVFYQTFSVINQLIPRTTDHPIGLAIRFKFFPAFCVSLLILFVGPVESTPFKLFFILNSISLIWIFIINPFVFHRGYMTYMDKMEAYTQNIIRENWLHVIEKIIKNNKYAGISLLIILVYSTNPLIESYGQRMASIKKDYLIIEENDEEFVVINSLDTRLIIAPVDTTKSTITPEFIIINAESNISDNLKMKAVYFSKGLKVKERTTVK